jgi:hypothetical protein
MKRAIALHAWMTPGLTAGTGFEIWSVDLATTAHRLIAVSDRL